jgi:restriction system protein
MHPLLLLHDDGGEHPIAQTRESIAALFDLTPEDREERLPSGRVTTLQNRVGWATTYLFRSGLLERPKRACYQITERGRRVLAENPDRIDLGVLGQFDEFQEFVGVRQEKGEAQEEATGSPGSSEGTPEEQMAAADEELRDALAADLLDRIEEGTWQRFEQLVLDVLERMGYGGLAGAVERIGGHGSDGGVDGVIRQDKLGLELIYIQAKAWKRDHSVSRPDVQAFVGALHGKGADKGVFMTTSRFTEEARQYAEAVPTRVILIDGRKLAELMIEYDVGVTLRQKFEIKSVDTDYFEPDAD